jgi:hypothetical protein
MLHDRAIWRCEGFTMKRLMVVTVLVLGLFPLAAWGAEPEASHRQAAADLLKMMNMEKTMRSGSNAMLDAQIHGNPALAPYRDVFEKWVGKYLTWDAVGPRMTDLYMQSFTEPELRDLIAFYKTPTGQKSLAKMPVLMQQGAQLGMEVAQQHKAELEEMIRARKAELEKAKTPEKKKPE